MVTDCSAFLSPSEDHDEEVERLGVGIPGVPDASNRRPHETLDPTFDARLRANCLSGTALDFLSQSDTGGG